MIIGTQFYKLPVEGHVPQYSICQENGKRKIIDASSTFKQLAAHPCTQTSSGIYNICLIVKHKPKISALYCRSRRRIEGKHSKPKTYDYHMNAPSSIKKKKREKRKKPSLQYIYASSILKVCFRWQKQTFVCVSHKLTLKC